MNKSYMETVSELLTRIIIKMEKEGKNISASSANFILSTLWFTSAINQLPKWKIGFFIQDILNVMNKWKSPTLSIMYIIFSDDIKNDVIKIFDENKIKFKTFILNEDEYDHLYDEEKLISNLYDKNETIHMNLMIIVWILMIKNSKKIYTSEKLAEEIINNYDGENSIQDLQKWSSNARATFVSFSHNPMLFVGLGYILSDGIIMNSYERKIIKEFSIGKMIFTTMDQIEMNNINLLTGNGLSKFITSKNGLGNWLSEQLSLESIKEIMISRSSELCDINLNIKKYSNDASENEKIINKIRKQCFEKQKYINSSEFIFDIFEFIEKFIFTRQIFDHELTSLINSGGKLHLNGPKFYEWIDDIFDKNKIVFAHKNRTFLFNSLYTLELEDLLFNIEAMLSVFDKYNDNSKRKDDLDKNELFIYIFMEAYIEKVWNKGDINFIDLKMIDNNFKNIFTLNYDNITDKIFGEAIHLHGVFDEVLRYDHKKAAYKKEHYKIKLKNKIGYYEQIIPNATTIILKGSDHKYDHIRKVMLTKETIERYELLENAEGDFIVVGTMLVGDPHILEVISKKKIKIYITYYCDEEFHKLSKILDYMKYAKRECEVFFVPFDDFVNYFNI